MDVIGVDPASEEVPRRAVQVLSGGGLVAFPTDTFYALGADARDEAAVVRVFAAKQRPRGQPLPVLVADREQWRTVVADLPEAGLLLADRFWPGALTIVCRRGPGIPPALVGGGDAIGVRQPALPVAVGLCRAFGGPVVGTSANVHSIPAPITATQVALDLGAEVNLILDGGRCPLARPSTVVDVTRTPPVVVRAGVVTLAALREVLGAVAVR